MMAQSERKLMSPDPEANVLTLHHVFMTRICAKYFYDIVSIDYFFLNLAAIFFWQLFFIFSFLKKFIDVLLIYKFVSISTS